MISKKVTIKNTTGLHLRAAGVFCNVAVRFNCSVTYKVRNTVANAKSVLSVLGSCVKCGDEIEIFCNGTDEVEALNEMIKAVENGLGE